MPFFLIQWVCNTAGSFNSFSTFLAQSEFSLCITASSDISLQNHLLSPASGIKLSLYVPSKSLSTLVWFDSNKQFCLYFSALLSYLSSFAPTTAKICRESPQHFSVLHCIFFQILIWRLGFAILLISFYSIVLTLCVTPSVIFLLL